ncbi:hypothetical protein IB262_21245 [Ensifer sp. ENS02]|uniref:hypothetical protein n=1 Tax=Ensifer sp. ENS02 TaxID=2769290 RepID=UPI0017876A68|nr:hypothetical protein [Ensifer sp. ENS02]MBD9522425.1 hypothetical protein [Ensifer sp. ENS02]
MSDHAPSVAEAQEAYELLKNYYSAADIQRRLGLTNRNTLDMILASPSRRVRLVSWALTVRNLA